MHLGRKYKLKEYLIWTRWEIGYLLVWSTLVTSAIEIFDLEYLEVPGPVLAIVGTAVAIVLGFKNQQCHARLSEALAVWGRINSASLAWAAKLEATVGKLDDDRSGPRLRDMFYRHFAWLTALRFFLRQRKTWENTFEPGNARFLAELPTPESRSTLAAELAPYFSEAEFQRVMAHKGDREAFLLRGQYDAVGDLHRRGLISDKIFVMLTNCLDDFVGLQGASKRIKNYPYPRNYYSIAVILVKAFVGMVPFGIFHYAQDLGTDAGLEHWTAWLTIPFSVFVGWIFVTLEKVGENSSNPFEGGPNDVPISFLARRIEIEMRLMLGEPTDLEPIQPKYDILF